MFLATDRYQKQINKCAFSANLHIEKIMEYKVSNADYLSIRAMREIGRQCTELVSALESIQETLREGGIFSFIYGPERVGVVIARHGYEPLLPDYEVAVHITTGIDESIWVFVPESVLEGAHFSRLVPSFLVVAIEKAETPRDRSALVELCFGHVSSHIFADVVSRRKASELIHINDFGSSPSSSSLDTLLHATSRSIHQMNVPRIDIRALFAWHILNPVQSAASTKGDFEEPDNVS